MSKRVTVLISGSGTNLQALIDAAGSPRLPDARITFVLSSRSNAYGLTRASNHQIPSSVSALKTYLLRHPGSTRNDYDASVAQQVLESKPDLVVLAGWMHIFSESFLDLLGNIPVINLHPALPGAFDGARAIERAFEAHSRGEIHQTGVMVHRVVKEVDRGQPLAVREVEIKADDTIETLEARIHQASPLTATLTQVEHFIIVEGSRIALGA